MKPSIALVAALLISLPTTAAAGVLTGRVVDSSGVGVAGVDLDFKSESGGGNPVVSNDGTDANGFFSTTVTPNGLYRVTFTPPPPPTTTHLVLRMDDVAIVGTTSIGTVVLAAGVAVSGRVLRQSSGLPVAGVNIDVVDLTTGNNLTLTNDLTNLAGQFSVAAPAGPIELRMNPESAAGPRLAPAQLNLVPSSNLNVGDQVLPPGFLVTALCKEASSGDAVEELDVDAAVSASGAKLYTPGDNTDAAGFVDFVVPAGTFDLGFCPQFVDQLVAREILNRTVTSDTFLGTLFLSDGVVLSGNVKSFTGTVQSGVDVNVEDALTGLKVVLCSDNTDSSGNYAVVVPPGNFEVKFSPSYAQPLGSDLRTLTVSNAGALQNGVLPACPFFSTTGSARTGTGGFTPTVSASGGSPRLGNSNYSIDFTQGLGGANAVVSLWTTPASAPPGFGPIQAFPKKMYRPVRLSGPVKVPGVGTATFPYPVGSKANLAGVTLHARILVRDPAAPFGVSMSHELQATFCP